VNGDLKNKDILVHNGKIKQIESIIPEKDVKLFVDLKNKIVLPGIIDPHVHFREPGLTHKEDWATGSRAAVKGGVTTVLDMPNTKPATISVELLQEKRKLAAEKSIVNFGFHFGSTAGNVEEIKKAKNIPSVKVFMDATTGNMLIQDKTVLNMIFSATKTISAHAEDKSVVKAINITKDIGNRLYLCHISTKQELYYIKQAGNVFCEVTPHHLFLTEEDYNKKGSLAMMKPMLKTKEDQIALWKGIEEGIVNTIGSDHAPHTIEEKESDNPAYGVPGVETLLPLMLNAVNEGKISLARVQKLTSENPAKIFGIKNKGKIQVGYDADLTIIDMEKEQKVQNKDMLTKCKWTPFDGMKLKGWPVMTIVNGNIIYDNGKINEILAKEIKIEQ